MRALLLSLWVLTGCGDGKLDTFAPAPAPIAPAELMIDDLEDQDTRLLGDFGWWYTQNDTTGTQTFSVSPVADRPGSTFAAYTAGQGFVQWGAIVGLDFTLGDGSYDLSAFRRIRFWAKAGPANRAVVSVQLLEGSDAHFGHDVQLSPEWRLHEFDFAAMPHTGGAIGRRFDAARAAGLQIFVLSSAPFEFWIDDVSVVR